MMISVLFFSWRGHGEPHRPCDLIASRFFRPKTSGQNMATIAVLHSVHRPLIVLEP